jgi:hypothetical protein
MSAAAPRGLPLRVDENARRRETQRAVVRAICASLLAAEGQRSGGGTATEILAKTWPSDPVAGFVLKAASNPATISTPGWAPELSRIATADFLSALSPASAATALLKETILLEWDKATGIKVPTIYPSATYAKFTGEAAAVPVIDFSTAQVTLSPRKMCVISLYSRELFQHSIPAIEALVGLALRESVGLALDVVMFSTNAATPVQPAGILNGITAITASTATVLSDAMKEDLSALVASVSQVSGNSDIIFVMSPKQSAVARLSDVGRRFDIFTSTALPAGMILAVASNALVSIVDPTPRFDSSIEATFQMDTVPVVSPITGPTSSMFQQDLVALRLRFDVSWALRAPQGAAWVQNTAW